MTLTWKFEFSAARVAVMFGAEVSNGVISEVRRTKDHIIRPVAFKYIKRIKLLYHTSCNDLKIGFIFFLLVLSHTTDSVGKLTLSLHS